MLSTSPAQLRQLNLWEPDCPTNCIVWDMCGGSNTAPCVCIRKTGRQECVQCHLICRERKTDAGSGLPADDFGSQVRAGLPLEALQLSHTDSSLHLPLLIPTRTQDFPEGTVLPLKWAAVDAKNLFTRHRIGPVKTRPFLRSPESTREYLRVKENTRLLAVINGKDNQLEGFWGMKRTDFYRTLQQCGFIAATGPTFSIILDWREAPACHNVCMLLRHNRVICEICNASITAIPNVYWQTSRDRQRWVRWLSNQVGVRFVSRDFSRTKQWSVYREELSQFIEVIRPLKRKLHVLLVGVGLRNAREALVRLGDIGCTCSVISASPIMRAVGGGRDLTQLPHQLTDYAIFLTA